MTRVTPHKSETGFSPSGLGESSAKDGPWSDCTANAVTVTRVARADREKVLSQ